MSEIARSPINVTTSWPWPVRRAIASARALVAVAAQKRS